MNVIFKRANLLQWTGSLLVILLATFATSCEGEQDFDIPVDPTYPDVQALIAQYETVLTAAPNGWAATLTPRLGNIFHLHMQLGTDKKVTMYADSDTIAAVQKTESVFRFENQGANPVIIFDGGSNLDRIAGLGKNEGVDKTYTIKSATNDAVHLIGNEYGDEIVLKTSSASYKQNFESGVFKSSIKDIFKYLPTVRLLYFEPTPGKEIQFIVRSGLRSTYFTYVQNDRAQFFGSDFAYNADGIHLKNAVTIHGVTIQDIHFDHVQQRFYVEYNGAPLYASASLLPLIPLHYLMGNEFSSGTIMVAPWLGAQPGWSYKFLERWTLADNALYEKDFGLGLVYFILDLNMDTQKMMLHVYTIDIYARIAVADFPYAFTKTADGVFDFEPLPIDLSTTRGQYANKYKTELSQLLDVVDNYTYHVNFYDNFGDFMPQYQSLQDTEMYFTGGFY